jgi:hypothetical protein
VTVYDVDRWANLFIATAGASAALAGLVFVAVSINIRAILSMKGVPERGLHTVLLLIGAVVVSAFGLVPQTSGWFGVELIIVGLSLLIGLVSAFESLITTVRGHPTWIFSRLVVFVPGSGFYLIGGISLLVGSGGGLAWVLVGIIGALVGGVINAWVLLVEILR